jgi:hypothetical protein
MPKKFTTGFKVEDNGEKRTFELTFSGLKNPKEAVEKLRTSLSTMEYQAILEERPNFGVSILICHTLGREKLLERLTKRLEKAYKDYSKFFEVIVDSTSGISIGEKRNNLLELAEKEYVCFIDDDDLVSEDYCEILLEGIKGKPDNLSLIGVITFDGISPKKFYHSIKYGFAYENNGAYFRPPNHLNCIKTEIAKCFQFAHKSHGEDMEWAFKIKESGLLQNEYEVQKPIYFYEYIPRK